MAGSVTIRSSGQTLALTAAANRVGTTVGVFADDRLTIPVTLPATVTTDRTFWFADGPVQLAVLDAAGTQLNVDLINVLAWQPRTITPMPSMAQLAVSSASSTAGLTSRFTTLEGLASDYQGQLVSSLADRTTLHGSVDSVAAQITAEVAARAAAVAAEAGARAGADTAELGARQQLASVLGAQITALQQAITALQAGQTVIRTAVASLPVLGLGATEVPLTWQTAMPSAGYTVLFTVEGATSVLGKLSVGVKSGTRAAAGCTATVTNSGLASISSGQANLHALAYCTGS
jgi:hypothetical protein